MSFYSASSQQSSSHSLLPFCAPHVRLTPLDNVEASSRPFSSSSDENDGGRLELHRDVKENPVTYAQDEFLHLYYYPRNSTTGHIIDQALRAQTEVFQESFGTFLLRVPNDFHTEDVPSSEQDPMVFDNFRLQFYSDIEGKFDGQLTGEFAKEYDSDYSIRTWGDLIDRLARIFHQYTTFQDPSLGGAMSPYFGNGYPDDKANMKAMYGSGAGVGSSSEFPTYDPSTFKDRNQGQLMFVDERTGSPVLNMEGASVEAQGIQPGIKDPVEIVLPEDGSKGKVIVRPAEYLRDAQDPLYADSRLIRTAVSASSFIVTTSDYIAKAMFAGAETFTKKVKPNATPVTFSPATHNRVQQFHNFSLNAAKYSSKAVGAVQQYAQNLGARVVGREERTKDPNKKPGVLNKSMIAFGTVADGIDHATKNLLNSTSASVTTVVGHKYGDEARAVAHGLGGSMRNVGLVYVDASGVSRRAVIKSVAKGMVVGKVKSNKAGQPDEFIVYGGGDEKSGVYGNGSASASDPNALPAYSPGNYNPSSYKDEKAQYSHVAPNQNYSPPDYGMGSSSSMQPQYSAARSLSPRPALPEYEATRPESGFGPQDSSVGNLGVGGLRQGGSGRSSPVPPPPGYAPPKY